MIQLPTVNLPQETQDALATWQAEVLSASSYAERVEAGKNLYRLRRSSKGFKPILAALSELCVGARRCCYCEDSAATDVDHLWPKDYYPDRVFVWENFVYACARCNRYKSNIWDVHAHVSGERISVHKLSSPGQEPPPGDALMIDPRCEDPFECLRLDLQGTFELRAHHPDVREHERAEYTVALLRLNEEDLLPTSRGNAYKYCVICLEHYIKSVSDHEPEEKRRRPKELVGKISHLTVWREMQRQQEKIPELRALFAQAPEALDW